MDSEPTFEQRRAIQDEQQFHDALAMVDFLLICMVAMKPQPLEWPKPKMRGVLQ